MRRCLLVLSFLWTLASGDTEVFCVFTERCILPCGFQSGTEVIIHWIQVTAEELRVHSFYQNNDQLGHQFQRFRNRTSLFRDQISRGNASLQLTGVQVQDQGRYWCHTSTIKGNKDSFITLKVNAPVHKIGLQQVGNRITCSSEAIYPEPKLTWSISPPSNITSNQTTVQQNEQQLYTISSSLILSDSYKDLDFICTISTRRNWKRATLFKPVFVNGSETETTLLCTSPTSVMDLIWRFNYTHSILTQARTDANYTVSDQWKQHVKDVSKSGNLTLTNLSSNQEGIYTCELSDAEETFVTNTFLRIDENKEYSVNVGGIIGGAVATIVIIAAAGLVWYWMRTRCQAKSGSNQRIGLKEATSQSGASAPFAHPVAKPGSPGCTCPSDGGGAGLSEPCKLFSGHLECGVHS